MSTGFSELRTLTVSQWSRVFSELFSELSRMFRNGHKRSQTLELTTDEFLCGIKELNTLFGELSTLTVSQWSTEFSELSRMFDNHHKRSVTPEIPNDLKAVVNGVGEILRKISGELSRH